jgi:uncharacterized protein (UPF0332 family)
MGRHIFGRLLGMAFDKEFYKNEFNRLLSVNDEKKFYIRKSNESFKINKFMKKSIDSLELATKIKSLEENAKDYWTITICYYSMLYIAKSAILKKGYETGDHYATQIALGHLFIPDNLEEKDLLLLEESYKILEEDYIDYFEDARKESSTSRYSATKVYTQRRVEEVHQNAIRFIRKMQQMI